MSLLSGNLSDWIVCKTVSQWPLFISLLKLSIESTVFNDIALSS